MVEIVVWFTLGLVVGWNFLTQPAFVKKGVDSIVSKVKSLFNK